MEKKSNILSIVPKLEEKKRQEKANEPLSVQQALIEVQNLINTKDESFVFAKADKCIIIGLDTSEGGYATSFVQAGCSATELIALLEVMKIRMLQLMGKV